MNAKPDSTGPSPAPGTLLERLRRRGVLRVAISYLLIGWLLLQIGDVVLDPLGAPPWAMRALILFLAVGFPVAVVCAWFLELGPSGVTVDRLPEDAARPVVGGIRRWADVIVIGALVLVVAVLLARGTGPDDGEPEAPVLAVLPFTMLGSEAPDDIGAGISDTLIHKLGQAAGIVVLAPSSTLEFRASNRDLAEVARMLRATMILDGSLQRHDGLLRINARLIEAEGLRQRWSATFDREESELFAIQDEIALAVTEALEVIVAPDERERLTHRQTENLDAWGLYHRARIAIASRAPDRLPRAIEDLQAAIAADPRFALAHAALAEAYFLASSYGAFYVRWSDVAGLAHEAAGTAQAIDPRLGNAWLAQAFAAMGDNAHAVEKPPWPREYIVTLLERAVALSPSDANAWKFLSNYTDDERLSLERLERAARLDPRSGIILVNLGGAYRRAGDPERARRWYALSIGTADPYFDLGLLSMMTSYAGQPDGLAMAARWGRSVLDRHPDDRDTAWREYNRALLELGAFDEVQRLVTAAAENPPPGGPRLLYLLGMQVRLDRIRGDLPAAARVAERFLDLVSSRIGNPGAILAVDGPPATILDAIPLEALHQGRPERALAHYEDVFGDLTDRLPLVDSVVPLGPLALWAASLKAAGLGSEAEAAFRRNLASLEEQEAAAPGIAGLQRFVLHAFLGEKDQAVAALAQALERRHLGGWWTLKDGAFDPDYAAVLADPRCRQVFAQLDAEVAGQRDSFLTDPTLPTEELVLAGIGGENGP